ncbi:MAG: DUF3078 domain-containing protein [Bacteroidales bacterium]|nr:DUF3078 domain-containing protein [Bacteroidales bacterium]
MFKIPGKFTVFIIALLAISFAVNNVYAQVEIKSDSAGFVIDTLMQAETVDSLANAMSINLRFDTKQAIEYLSQWYDSDMWNSKDHPLRKSIQRLLFEATSDPLYVSEDFVRQYEWQKIKIPASSFYMWDTILIPIPSENNMKREFGGKEDIFDPLLADTSLVEKDTVYWNKGGDTVINRGDSVIMIDPEDFDNIFVKTGRQISAYPRDAKHDSIIIVISDTLKGVISSNPEFPFLHYDYPLVGDSIHAAVKTVMDYIEKNDSSRVIVTGARNSIPVWLSNNTSRLTRLWLKNEWDEEVSVWIGGSSRDSIDIIVEKGVHFRRLDKTTNIADARLELKTIDNSKLAEARKIDVKPQYWKFLSEASFIFNQAVIKNWVKGGESNISTVLDISGTASYTNKEKKIIWNNIGRIKFGLITSGRYGIRKNTDNIDIISKYNNKAFGKFDFSATMIFMTQLAYGYNYPNDSVVVSKFFNPASLTIGLGLDYKPNDNTSINFAPLSYKGTFVPDTAMIDQTKHGLLADQRSKHEPGISMQINHKTTIFKDINLVNNVRLFTNYIHNPQNIDIDWELIATAKLNWFTDLRLNTHLIYDDDTLIPVKDDDGEQVLNQDGTPKKVPMIQFKEIIGISVIFRF